MAETGPFICAIKQDIDKIKAASEMLKSDIRKLRRDLTRCRACPQYKGCEQINNFKETINEALEEIYQEWGIENQ